MQIPLHSNCISCPKIVPPSAPVFYWLSCLTCILNMKAKTCETQIFTVLKMSKSKQHFFCFQINYYNVNSDLFTVVWPGHQLGTHWSKWLESTHNDVIMHFMFTYSFILPIYLFTRKICNFCSKQALVKPKSLRKNGCSRSGRHLTAQPFFMIV